MSIENEILLPLNADHSSICKFQSSDDPQYKQVKGLINEFVMKGPIILASRKQMSTLAAGVQSSLDPNSPDQATNFPIPFLQITREERDNALKTSELKPLYCGTKDFRTQKIKILHSAPWETLEEEVIHKDHWWPPVSDEARSVKGAWIMYYPPNTKLATVRLSIDWHAYETDLEDPLEPLIQWTVDTPDSEYHPGKHRGTIYVKDIVSGIRHATVHVVWKSAIYSPYVRARDPGDGSIAGDPVFEQISVDLTETFEAIAHALLFGPFNATNETFPLALKLRYENTHIWKKYKKQSASDQEAFKRAASFFSRAYNQDSAADIAGTPKEQDLEPKALVTSIKTIKELLQLYRPQLLEASQTKDWDFRAAFAKVETRREWALEEKGWADRIVEACDLKFLKQYQKAQKQQEQYQAHLALRNKSAVSN
ncbi:MAG: hypothetical protein Q9172_003612 [Xanthocarpia lactea]